MIRRLALSSVAAIAASLVAAAPVAAHIHADPSQAQAGSTQTIGFTIEHGCSGSPTVAVDMLVPEGATDVTPEPFEGWTASLATNDDGEEVLSYTDGSLPDGEAGTFEVTLTLPPTPDTTVYFPIVQRCEEGELRWIETPVNGEEPDYPAPAVELVGPVVTPDTTPSDTVTPDTTPSDTVTPDTVTHDTVTPDTVDSTTPAATETTTADTVPASVPTTSIADDADDGDSNIGTVAFILSAIAVLIVAGIAYTVARRNRQGQDGAAPNDVT